MDEEIEDGNDRELEDVTTGEVFNDDVTEFDIDDDEGDANDKDGCICL
jgi:hypothetical protein